MRLSHPKRQDQQRKKKQNNRDYQALSFTDRLRPCVSCLTLTKLGSWQLFMEKTK